MSHLPYNTRLWCSAKDIHLLPDKLSKCDLAGIVQALPIEQSARDIFFDLQQSGQWIDVEEDWKNWSLGEAWDKIFHGEFAGPQQLMERRENENGLYFVQNEQSFLASKNRIDELKRLYPDRLAGLVVLRSSLTAIQNSVAVYPSETMCLEQLKGSRQLEPSLLKSK